MRPCMAMYSVGRAANAVKWHGTKHTQAALGESRGWPLAGNPS